MFLSTTSNVLDRLKGHRWFEIVDAKTFRVLDRFDMREKTKEYGKEWKDSAVRPMAISPTDDFVYLQMSFLHGFFEFNVKQKRITRRLMLPGAELLDQLRPGDFQLNSANHGITISGDGEKLCVAGTMTGRAYIVRLHVPVEGSRDDQETFATTPIDLHDPPREGPEQVDTELKPVLVDDQRRREELLHLDQREEPGRRDLVRRREGDRTGRRRAQAEQRDRPPTACPQRPHPRERAGGGGTLNGVTMHGPMFGGLAIDRRIAPSLVVSCRPSTGQLRETGEVPLVRDAQGDEIRMIDTKFSRDPVDLAFFGQRD